VRAGRQGCPPVTLATRRPGDGAKRRGTKGISTPCSPWTEMACGGGSAAPGGGRLWWLVVVVFGVLGGVVVRLGLVRGAAGPFIAAERR
jgi:hypothetical protein